MQPESLSPTLKRWAILGCPSGKKGPPHAQILVVLARRAAVRHFVPGPRSHPHPIPKKAGPTQCRSYTRNAMLAIAISDLPYVRYLIASPAFWVVSIFQIWMLIDAIRKQEWMWVAFIIFFPGFGTFWYFFSVYRQSPSATRGF